MLAIILTILKVIGITLLVILGLVLFILAIVLFVPIRYKGDGIINDKAKEAHLKVTWLLHAVHVQVDYCHPDNPITIIKVLGINIEKFKKKKKDVEEEPPASAVVEEKPQIEAKPPKKEKKPKKKKRQRYDINLALLDDAEKDVDFDAIEEPDAVDTPATITGQQVSCETPEEEPVSENIRRMVEQAQALQNETWRDKLKRIVNKITSVYNKVKDVILNIRYYLDILQEEDTKAMIHITLDALLDILKKLRPRKLVANAKIGFDTPDTTGKLYGLYWMIKPALGEHVVLEPVFEEKVIEGDIFFKGRITIFTILVNALKVVLDKRFMPLINKFKNGGTQNGREK